jgi:signal transduction histidine kinase
LNSRESGARHGLVSAFDAMRRRARALRNHVRELITLSHRHDADGQAAHGPTVLIFALGLCGTTVALAWLGYVATREWRHSTDQLLQRQTTEALALAGAALNRDMKGAWATVVVPINLPAVEEELPYDLLHVTARAFARFPYPESFLVWRNDGTSGGSTYAFNRADRRPVWDRTEPSPDPFPVVLQHNPPALRGVIDAVLRQAPSGSTFVSLEDQIGGDKYQIVAHLLFTSSKPPTLAAVVAFTVNLRWVRESYFGPILAQVSRIGGNDDAVLLEVYDDHGERVASSGSATPDGADSRLRHFPLVFIDPVAVSAVNIAPRPTIEWTLSARPIRTGTLLAASQGANRLFALVSLTAVVSMLALLLTVRAVRASALLASMKSDFVSAVTHELKTPVATIRLVGDTLATGRYESRDTIQEYAGLLSQEAARLSHSIDNLLTYSRYTTASKVGAVALCPADVGDLVDQAVIPFRPVLAQAGFQLSLDVPRDLPLVSADRAGLIRVMENIIDNAIKYSETTRALSIAAREHGRFVHVTFSDKGIGISAEEIHRVCDRFYRGRNATVNGSGLGLTIARRILDYHGGALQIRSDAGVGTEVDLLLAKAHA